MGTNLHVFLHTLVPIDCHVSNIRETNYGDNDTKLNNTMGKWG